MKVNTRAAAIMVFVNVKELHPWNLTPAEARAIQQNLASSVSHKSDMVGPVNYVAGLDVSPPNEWGIVRGAAVVLEYPSLNVAEVGIGEGVPGFPYVPGLLSFREAPVLQQALERLSATPDLLVLDGQGYAHPRRFGLACHIGVLADVPTLGCAKSILVGSHGPLAPDRGAWAELVHRDEVIGMAVRTRTGVKPLYVSVGHRIDLKKAVDWVLALCTRYRLPQTTRLAHAVAGGLTL